MRRFQKCDSSDAWHAGTNVLLCLHFEYGLVLLFVIIIYFFRTKDYNKNRFLHIYACYQLFSAAAEVLQKIGEDGRLIQEFVDLGVKAKAASTEAMDTESMLGDIPDEFLDPIQVARFLFRIFFLCGTYHVHSRC